jgi:hypothetical protein
MSLESDAPAREAAEPSARSGNRVPLIAFAFVELVALPVLLITGRKRWFFGDDWFFLTQTTKGGFGSVFRTNTYGHWMTLPILAYRLLWWLFGLRHFKAFLLLVIVLHLTVAALLRLVMRRGGAGPWISTIAASMLVFFGPGAFNIFVPFQITFDGSLAFGLSHLLLADHDGKFDRRDIVGMVCGLAGLMCSNVSIAMVATVGLAVLLRRGWRMALLHTAPLGAIYVAWWFVYARGAHGLLGKRASLGELVPFIWKGLRQTFEHLGYFPIVGLVLAAIFVAGLVVAWTQVTDVARSRYAAATALAGGAVVFIASAGLLRASPAITHDAGYLPRYVYVSAAMLLPALAVAITALTRRWRQIAPIPIIALLVGLPGNYHELTSYGARFPRNYRHSFLVLAQSPVARRLPSWMQVPAAGLPGYMTAGWLVTGVKSGRIPGPGSHVSPKQEATAALTLSLSPYQFARRSGPCRPSPATTVVLRNGDQIIAVTGTFSVVLVTDSGVTSARLQVIAPRRFQAHASDLTLRIIRPRGRPPANIRICTRSPES